MPTVTTPPTKRNGKSSSATRAGNRLPRPTTPVNRARELRIGVLGVLGVAIVVIGVPAALIAFVGYPLPRSAPSKEWLTTSVSSTLIINILACVVWLVWAHFVVCLIAEWRAVRRGRLTSAVPFGGGSQVIARRLVAAALLLGGVAAVVPHHTRSTSVAVPRPAVSATAAAPATGSASAAAPGGSLAHPAIAPDAARANDLKYYVVAPPDGRRYDCLWDIAERTLGDPLRYKEIFALNKDRTQADGRNLVDANLILPGWQLRLPGDATGVGVHAVHAAPPATRPTPAPAPAVPIQPASPGATTGAALASTLPATAFKTSAVGDEESVDARSLLFGGGLMLAGVLVALSARRGPYATGPADENRSGDPTLAQLLDRALRSLAAGRTAQLRELPQPAVAWVSNDRIVLHLVGGDTSDPPAPWQIAPNGRSWSIEPDAVPPAVDAPAPFPGLVSVGRSHGFDVFVDLEQAPGLIAVGGDLARARDLVTAIAVQVATSVWSDGARVNLVGFSDKVDLSALDERSITQVARLADVLDDVEHDDVQRENLQRRLGVHGVLAGRQLAQDTQWLPRIVVLSGPPTPDEALRLQRLTGPERTSVVALCVGDAPSARWRFAVDGQGVLDLGVLGATAHAHRLTVETGSQLVQLMQQAAADRRERADDVATLSPYDAVTASLDTPAAPPAPEPAAVRIRLLGPVTVDAPGSIEPTRRDLATEILVAVFLAPHGLRDAVLRAAIWPRGVSDDVVEAALRDVSVWLGVRPDGVARVAMDDDGCWRVTPDVQSDWDELRRLAADARGGAEADQLSRACGLFAGEAFSGTSAGRFHWLAFARAARDARLLGTTVSRRLAVLLVGQKRRADAADALRAGLRLVPTAELIWRDLLVLTSWDGPDGAAAVAEEMYATLGRHRAWPEPETDALVAQAAPGYRHDQAG